MRMLSQALVIVLVLLVFPLPGNQASMLHSFNVRFPVTSKAPQKPPHFYKPTVVAAYTPAPKHLDEVKPLEKKPTIQTNTAKKQQVKKQTPAAKKSRLRRVSKNEVNFNGSSLPKQSIVVIGDSLSIPLGQRLEEYFSKYNDISFARRGKVSSGLARPDFFDWDKNLTEMVEKNSPTTLVIMIGTNDNKSLKRRDGKVIAFGNPNWAKEYTRRMKHLFDIARKANPKCRIFWVGAPIMEPKKLNTDVMRINHVIRTLCQRTPNCRYVDTWDALADDDGHFAQYATNLTGERVRLRANDGVHVTHFASKILAVRCLKAIADAS